MKILKVTAEGYRNLSVTGRELSPGINILYGDNAQGKTNFLEAVYFCAFGRSMRSRNDRELISWGSSAAHIRAEFERGGHTSALSVHLEQTAKGFAIDRVPIRHMKDLFGRVLVVAFSPEDLRLVKAGPVERRRFMDMEICQLSPVYYSGLKEYYRALKQRNSLLKTLQNDCTQADSISIWDEQLSKYGLRIMKTRAAFVRKIGDIAAEVHRSITQNAEELRLEYKPGITEAYAASLAASHERDIVKGSTREGIHTDDIDFTINGISVRKFGSQGQQRTAALSAKLAEIRVIEESTGESPILLLDDVLSELDAHRQKFLLAQIHSLQTIITCTGIEDMLSRVKDCRILRVEGGRVFN